MKQEIKRPLLIAALLAIALGGCQKKEEASVPEVGAEAPAMPSEPAPMAEPAPGMAPMEAVPMEPAPKESAPDNPPSPLPAQ